MNFSDFLYEAKSLKLSTDELKTSTSITNTYIESYQKTDIDELISLSTLLPRTIFPDIYLDKADKSCKPRFIHIGKYKVTERKSGTEKLVDVFLIINALSTKNDGVYRESAEEIYLFQDSLYRLTRSQILNIVSHEIIHAVQHYKETSDKYKSSVNSNNNTDYYIEPVEIEATLGGIVTQLYEEFRGYLNVIKKHDKLEDVVSVKYFTRRLMQFLNGVTLFANTSPRKYDELTVLEVPEVFLNYIEFFKELSKNERVKQKYQTDLYKLIQRMKKDFEFVKRNLK